MKKSTYIVAALLVPSCAAAFSLSRRKSFSEVKGWNKFGHRKHPLATLHVATPQFSTGTRTASNSSFVEHFTTSVNPELSKIINKSINKQPKTTVGSSARRRDELAVGATVLGGVVTLLSMVQLSEVGSWRYFLAGGICASVSHALVTPLDVVKTRKQVNPELENLSFHKATMKIVDKEGVRALLAGLGPTSIGYLFEGAMKFGIYEVMKPAVRHTLTSLAGLSSCLAFLESQAISFVISGCISGLAASIMLCPMEAIRIRQVADPAFAPTGRWQECGLKMLRTEGIQSLWKGIAPMVYKQVPYTVAKNVAFDYLTRFAYFAARGSGQQALSSLATVAIPIVSAVVTSVLSTVFSQPGDLLLSLVNANGNSKKTNELIGDILRSDRGARGFFVGTKTRLLHVGTIVTTQLILYDLIKRLCGIAATGSV